MKITKKEEREFREKVIRLSEIAKTQTQIWNDYGLHAIEIENVTDLICVELKDIIEFFPEKMVKKEVMGKDDALMVTWDIKIEWNEDNIQQIQVAYIEYRDKKLVQISSPKK